MKLPLPDSAPIGDMMAALDSAIAADALSIHYQPVVALASGRMVGVEALMRWARPDGSFVSPDAFVPSAEATGRIVPMTEWLMRRAAVELAPLFAQQAELYIAVNLSAQHFESERIVDALDACFGQAGIAARRVHLEVTERELLHNRDGLALSVMTALRRRGHVLALDDFGTGYSDRAALDRFPFDALKIDKSFVAAIADDGAPDEKLLRALVIANARRLTIVAEGIEHSHQATALAALGVGYGQGHFYSEPINVATLADYLAARA